MYNTLTTSGYREKYLTLVQLKMSAATSAPLSYAVAAAAGQPINRPHDEDMLDDDEEEESEEETPGPSTIARPAVAAENRRLRE